MAQKVNLQQSVIPYASPKTDKLSKTSILELLFICKVLKWRQLSEKNCSLIINCLIFFSCLTQVNILVVLCTVYYKYYVTKTIFAWWRNTDSSFRLFQYVFLHNETHGLLPFRPGRVSWWFCICFTCLFNWYLGIARNCCQLDPLLFHA